MDRSSMTYGISRTSGGLASLVGIVIAAMVMVPLAYLLLPSTVDDVVRVLEVSLIIPVIALFKPLQKFVFLPGALGFGSIFGRKLYAVPWADVTDVRLRQDVFGVTTLEFKQKDRRIYRKVPLTIMPRHREFLLEIMKAFPENHPKRSLLENIIRPYIELSVRHSKY